jgi:nitroreductase
MRRHTVALAAGLVLATLAPGSAEIFAPQSLEHDFRVEWQLASGPRGAAIDGYVYNRAKRAAEHMRLVIERLDAAGAVVGASTVWVPGEVPMDNRAYFHASVPEAAATYRVRILSLDWIIDPGGGM